MTRTSTFLGGGVLMMAAMLTVASPADARKRVLHGALIGAGTGAVAGAIIPGLSVGEGALIGGAGGAAIGALSKNGHRHRHHYSHGNRYWVDKHGRRHYH
jgi:uncharacterized membrane protein